MSTERSANARPSTGSGQRAAGSEHDGQSTVSIANCIHRIFNAEAHVSNFRRRELDIAHAVTVASSQGETAAHEYLIRICGQAESGKYKTKGEPSKC